MATDPHSHLPLPPAVLQIMLALADGEKHGYAIMQEVGEQSDGEMRLGPGTLYGALKRMLDDKLIAERASDDDERRRTYRLTAFGRKVASAEVCRLQAMVRWARRKKLPAV
jgi:DNA-binding PadR family transcriptional regulator